MSLTDVAANERVVPVFPDHRVSYVSPEVEGYVYTIRSGPSLNVALQRENDHWIAVEAETGIFCHGNDVLEAIKDFQAAVVEHLDVLERRPALSDELAWQLDYLRARVRR
jgi:hypothetical protein